MIRRKNQRTATASKCIILGDVFFSRTLGSARLQFSLVVFASENCQGAIKKPPLSI
jgi:hypothetical protein